MGKTAKSNILRLVKNVQDAAYKQAYRAVGPIFNLLLTRRRIHLPSGQIEPTPKEHHLQVKL